MIYETIARDFPFWSPVKETIDLAREVGREDELYDILDETPFNDYVGYNIKYDDMMTKNNSI